MCGGSAEELAIKLAEPASSSTDISVRTQAVVNVGMDKPSVAVQHLAAMASP